MRVRSATSWWAHPAPWGLALRLLLMPIGACWDLFGYYWLSHQWVYHGAIPLNQYGGYLRAHPLFYLHSAWLWLIRPLIGPGDPWGEGLVPSASLAQFWIGPETIRAFYLHPQIHWVLFLLKCPYLLAEVWLIRLLLRHAVRSVTARRRLSWFLWLNPLSLYTVSLFGAWDVIPVALMILSAVLLPRRTLWAGLCFALAIILKVFPLLVLPFFVLRLRGKMLRQVTFILAALLPALMWVAAGEWFGIQMLSTIRSLDHWNMLISWQVPLGYHDHLYLFIVGYTLVCFHATRSGVPSFAHVVRYGAAAFLLFYSLSFFHPQYVFWVLPFLAILVATHPWLLWVFALQVICFLVYTLQWEGILTTYLVAPLNPEFFLAQPSPYEWLARYTDPEPVIGIAHSVLAAASLWMIYEILRSQPLKRA